MKSGLRTHMIRQNKLWMKSLIAPMVSFEHSVLFMLSIQLPSFATLGTDFLSSQLLCVRKVAYVLHRMQLSYLFQHTRTFELSAC
jgi:hypothetical protein